MGKYCDAIDAAPAAERWKLARGFIYSEPEPFFAEMRAERPVLVLPELTLAFRFTDCILVARRHQDFGVDRYKPKQGDYFMAQDWTADHWRDKSIMRAILDFEDVPAIRAFVGKRTSDILDAAHGEIDAPKKLTRAVPIGVVRDFFGFAGTDPAKLEAWSYWNQQDAFHNQPQIDIQVTDPQHIVDERVKANKELAIHTGLILAKRWLQARILFQKRSDSVSRLVRLQATGAIRWGLAKILFNVGGLLIGAVETTSHVVNYAMQELARRPDQWAAAKVAALSGDTAAFDPFVFEALRFNPAFSYFFRTCHRPTWLAAGTPHAVEVQPGTTVIAVAASAMRDAEAFPDPGSFDTGRALSDCFTFGQGLHECLGIQIAYAMVPEIVRQCLRRPGFAPAGELALERSVPEHYVWRWDV
ncbi:cytochrome P450 [Sphingomonas sp.]|uniref:cytochrome P450 n=1 Tax=Sphingomonas sp. TaxID=28214 RepID=UPI001B270C17|nr:cytochrome P450 [Sphingomonas sp.]MBO9713073.1 cytochrome P450 [Sphingomonas sp.]